MKTISKRNVFMKVAYNAGYRVDSIGNVIKNGVVKRLRIPSCKYKYAQFTMYFNKKKRFVAVHRLCAYQKYGDALFQSQCVRHLDGNSLNNAPSNIAIGTLKDNSHDIPKTKRVELAKNASLYMQKYNHHDVIEYYNEVKSYKKVMQKFNISSKGTVSFIIRKSIESNNYNSFATN